MCAFILKIGKILVKIVKMKLELEVARPNCGLGCEQARIFGPTIVAVPLLQNKCRGQPITPTTWPSATAFGGP